MAPNAKTTAQLNFNPGAVTDNGLDMAKKDIAGMSFEELRELVTLLDTCTARGHPIERTGKCGASVRRYKASYAKGRDIDLSLTELERVVRYQSMFTHEPRDRRFEDGINDRLRASGKESLAAAVIQRELTARGSATAPDFSRTVSMRRK